MCGKNSKTRKHKKENQLKNDERKQCKQKQQKTLATKNIVSFSFCDNSLLFMVTILFCLQWFVIVGFCFPFTDCSIFLFAVLFCCICVFTHFDWKQVL